MNNGTDGEWGLYPWFEECSTSLIHPDDLEQFRLLFPHGKVFQLTGRNGDYITLAYGSRHFRVKPDLFTRVPDVIFPVGSVVEIIDKGIEAEIESTFWHHQNEKPFYLLRYNDRSHTRRYWQEELRRRP